MKIKIIVLALAFVLVSCMSKVDCEKSSQSARETGCLLIFEELPTFTSPFLNAKGRHLITNKECECEDGSRWLSLYDDLLEKGDTIIKRRGELVVSIHKKDTVLSFNWKCKGEVYK